VKKKHNNQQEKKEAPHAETSFVHSVAKEKKHKLSLKEFRKTGVEKNSFGMKI